MPYKPPQRISHPEAPGHPARALAGMHIPIPVSPATDGNLGNMITLDRRGLKLK